MIENKCVQTNEPEQTLIEMNRDGYRLITAIAQFNGLQMFFEREAVTADAKPQSVVVEVAATNKQTAEIITASNQGKGKRK